MVNEAVSGRQKIITVTFQMQILQANIVSQPGENRKKDYTTQSVEAMTFNTHTQSGVSQPLGNTSLHSAQSTLSQFIADPEDNVTMRFKRFNTEHNRSVQRHTVYLLFLSIVAVLAAAMRMLLQSTYTVTVLCL